MYIVLILAGILGLIIGSFANVFILRYRTGRSLNGRSACASCGKKLAWYELIPVVSYLIQRGRCSECESRVSIQYPVVELVFGVLFALSAHVAFANSAMFIAIPHLMYLWIACFLLISIAVYDIKHLIIPNGMLYALFALIFIWHVGNAYAGDISIGLTFLAGPLTALPLFLLWFLSNGRWMGFGDVKFALAMGWMLGIVGGLSAFVFAVWAGALVSLAVIGISRLVSRRSGLTMKSMIPFGPFLVAATLFVLLTGVTMEMFLVM